VDAFSDGEILAPQEEQNLPFLFLVPHIQKKIRAYQSPVKSSFCPSIDLYVILGGQSIPKSVMKAIGSLGDISIHDRVPSFGAAG
jgi:hypothetical protein